VIQFARLSVSAVTYNDYWTWLFRGGRSDWSNVSSPQTLGQQSSDRSWFMWKLHGCQSVAQLRRSHVCRYSEKI